MITTMSLKMLRPELPHIIDQVDRKLDRFIITKRGKPVAVMLSVDDYEALMETLDVLADPEAMHGLRAGEADIRKRRHRPWSDIKRDLAKL